MWYKSQITMSYPLTGNDYTPFYFGGVGYPFLQQPQTCSLPIPWIGDNTCCKIPIRAGSAMLVTVALLKLSQVLEIQDSVLGSAAPVN
jgi:hypothetical protein